MEIVTTIEVVVTIIMDERITGKVGIVNLPVTKTSSKRKRNGEK